MHGFSELLKEDPRTNFELTSTHRRKRIIIKNLELGECAWFVTATWVSAATWLEGDLDD